jgi:hypothetical protein
MVEEPAAHDIEMSDMFQSLCEQTGVVFPPEFDAQQERSNLEDQSRIMAQAAEERDEFGDSFFDERDETRELRESLQAMGERERSLLISHNSNLFFRHRGLCRRRSG